MAALLFFFQRQALDDVIASSVFQTERAPDNISKSQNLLRTRCLPCTLWFGKYGSCSLKLYDYYFSYVNRIFFLGGEGWLKAK